MSTTGVNLQAQGRTISKSYKEALLQSGPREAMKKLMPEMAFEVRDDESAWLKGADGDTIKHSGNPMAQMSGNSIGDSNIENMNQLYLEKQVQDEAKMFWEMGMRLGATFEGDETEVVE
ncbi:hypothetical protein Ancab_015195 [Ancistrocladus abbreviatus]